MGIDCVEKLSKAASYQVTQIAYTALSKFLQCEWSYLQRVMHKCGDAFVPLQDAIIKAFYSALFEGHLTDAGCKLSVDGLLHKVASHFLKHMHGHCSVLQV